MAVKACSVAQGMASAVDDVIHSLARPTVEEPGRLLSQLVMSSRQRSVAVAARNQQTRNTLVSAHARDIAGGSLCLPRTSKLVKASGNVMAAFTMKVLDGIITAGPDM